MVLDLYASTNGGSTNDPFDWLITRWVFAQKGTDLERINERLKQNINDYKKIQFRKMVQNVKEFALTEKEVQGIKLMMKGGGQPAEGLGMPINYTEIVPYSEKDNHTEIVPYSENTNIVEAIDNFEQDVDNLLDEDYFNLDYGEDMKQLIFFYVKVIKAISLSTAKGAHLGSVAIIRLCNIFIQISCFLLITPLGQILFCILCGYYIFSPHGHWLFNVISTKAMQLWDEFQEPILSAFKTLLGPIIGPIVEDSTETSVKNVVKDVVQDTVQEQMTQTGEQMRQDFIKTLTTTYEEMERKMQQRRLTDQVSNSVTSSILDATIRNIPMILQGATNLAIQNGGGGGKKNTKRKKKIKKTRGKTKGKKRRRKTKKKL